MCMHILEWFRVYSYTHRTAEVNPSQSELEPALFTAPPRGSRMITDLPFGACQSPCEIQRR